MIPVATIRKRWQAIIIAAGTVAVLLFHYKGRETYYCQICFSKKDVIQWRLGAWGTPSVPLTPQWERIADTNILHAFFSTNHVHDWAFAQASPYYFFGTTWGGCALGKRRHLSEVSRMYESSSEFRDFVSRKISNGSLTKSNFVALLPYPGAVGPTPPQKELLDEYFAQ